MDNKRRPSLILNPLDQQYHDTEFSVFLRDAASEHAAAVAEGRPAHRPFHLVLDEMNLARVEYYFAKFIEMDSMSAMFVYCAALLTS